MLIGICGSLCAGRTSVQQFLIKEYGFTPLEIGRPVQDIPFEGKTPPLPSHGRDPRSHVFQTVDDLLNYATQSWQTNYCTTSISSASIAETLSHRPWFLLVHIDAPLSVRWKRHCQRSKDLAKINAQSLANTDSFSSEEVTLERFVSINDSHLYDPTAQRASLASHAHLQLLNTAPSLPTLHQHLRALNLPDSARLRPTWDHYFMTLASLASKRSNCMRRRVGCVLIRNNRVISTGYNGTPRNVVNCNSGGCPRCNSAASTAGGAALATCLCLHAEENALLEAGRERIGNEAVLYCDTCPCLTCSIKIVQVGIGEVVFSKGYYMDEASARIFKEAGVRLRQFSPVKEGLVVLGELGEGVPGV
ncbi:hypothetical protein MBLNU230_g0779t1 [Neophaeotheca triangularis]